MKKPTPTLAQLRKLAKKKGVELQVWDIGGFYAMMKGKTIMGSEFGRYTSVGLTITKSQSQAMVFAALSALPDAERKAGV